MKTNTQEITQDMQALLMHDYLKTKGKNRYKNRMRDKIKRNNRKNKRYVEA